MLILMKFVLATITCKSGELWFTKIKVKEITDDIVVSVAKVMKELVFKTAQ